MDGELAHGAGPWSRGVPARVPACRGGSLLVLCGGGVARRAQRPRPGAWLLAAGAGGALHGAGPACGRHQRGPPREGKGEEGEDYEPGAEGEGKTRSKMQEKNRRVRSRASQRTAPPGCLKQPGVVGQAKAVGGHQHDDMSLSHPLVQGMPCSWGVCRARAPSPRRARLARGPRLRRGFTLHRAARRAGAEALPRAPEDQGCGADGGHACAGAEALP